jgi:membrane-associated phospholipid phosphatase
VAEVVTWIGALPVAGGALVLTAALLAWRRRALESFALGAGLALVVLAVHVAKDAVDRPRPLRSIVATMGHSFPSGHSAYAIFWVAIAVALMRAAPGLAGRFAVLAAGIAVAVAVALTRLYLRAHFLSDVVAGAGLSAAILSGCGLFALIVGHVRHNGRRA